MEAEQRTEPGGRQAGALAGASLVQVVLYVRDPAASRSFYEGVLGLVPAQGGEGAATYATGQARLSLRPAADGGVTPGTPDTTADVTFLVPHLDSVRDALAARGVEFTETQRYVIGATAGFLDPDGHQLSLYEPSATAMTWPSGGKIRALLRAAGRDPARYGAGRPPPGAAPAGLGEGTLVYLFLFVPHPEPAIAFYHRLLGFSYLECRPCRCGGAEHPQGVVKYDAGGVLLTTHYLEGPKAEAAGPLEPARMKALSAVFRVDDVERVVAELGARGVRTGPVSPSAGGRTAWFEDPFGRVFHLLQPSPAMADAPVGAAPAEILSGAF
ncbi:MAG TPA: VOC family protein [Longimicrobium sp.]